MIIKEFTTPHGAAAGFHVLKRIEVNAPFTSAHLNVQSYASEAAFLAGAGVVWNSPVDMPLGLLDGALGDLAEIWLTTDPDSPFAGGTIVTDQSLTLECAQVRRWAAIKARRDAVEAGGFVVNGDRYDSDMRSAQRIAVAAQSALAQRAAVQPYTVDWILADNSIRTLDGVGMIAVAAALAEHGDTTISTARGLRDQIAAATTIDQVDAIQWPAPAQ